MGVQPLLQKYKTLKNKVSSLRDLLKIEEYLNKIKEFEQQMLVEGFWDNQDHAYQLSKKLTELKKEYENWSKIEKNIQDIGEVIILLENQEDAHLENEIQMELDKLELELEQKETVLLFQGSFDTHHCFLSINAGAGGTESNDWVTILSRMFLRWANDHQFETEIIDELPGEEVGIKNITIHIKGSYAYGYLRGESGVHRLVRISPFDTNARRHTSFASVSVSPDIEDTNLIEINPSDLRIDTYRASGAGGQHVNKTDSAVRIVHLPTNITVSCQSQRSQFKNKEKAMKLLQSKIFQYEEDKKKKEREKLQENKKEISWGNQIRSYIFHPYKLIKDARTALEIGNVDKVMDGGLDPFMIAYLKWQIKKILIIVFFHFILSSCAVVQKEKLDSSEYPPAPRWITSREILIEPVYLQDQYLKDEWLFQDAFNQFENSLKVISSVPYLKSLWIVVNATEIYNFYEPNKNIPYKEKLDYVQQAVLEGRTHKLRVFPDQRKEILENYIIPEKMKFNFSRLRQPVDNDIIEKKLPVIFKMIQHENKIMIRIYDSFFEKDFFRHTFLLDTNWNKMGIRNKQNFLNKKIQKAIPMALQQYYSKPIYKVIFKNRQEKDVLFIDHQVIESSSVFLAQGKHLMEILKDDFPKISRWIDVTENSSVSLDLDVVRETKKLKIETNPSGAAIFIDEVFRGIAPLDIDIAMGEHFIRAALLGYDFYSSQYSNNEVEKGDFLQINLKKEDLLLDQKIASWKQAKYSSFILFLAMTGGYIFSRERYNFYLNQGYYDVLPDYAAKRYAQFGTLTNIFLAGSITFGATAALSQVIEWELKNTGIGNAQEQYLGVRVHF